MRSVNSPKKKRPQGRFLALRICPIGANSKADIQIQLNDLH